MSSPLSCNEATRLLAKQNEHKIESDQAVEPIPSEAVSFPYCTEVTKLSESESLKPVEPIPCDKRNCSTANNNINEELRHPSPKQQRLEKLDSEDIDDSIRCNCKKTKCLNLVGYCDCFSAGKHCAENCSCQECFNRPEYEEIVIGTRQLITFWDPRAFDPKIIQHETAASTKRSMVELFEDKGFNSNIDEELRQSSPKQIWQELEKLDAEDNVGGKHCNCNKFTCLMFECDYFAAGVDCTEACACAPKIIQHATETSTKRSTDLIVSSSARHKEGETARSQGHLEDNASNSNISGDLQQSIPKQKRLEKLDVLDNDVSKRCNCTKIKCLKLYCVCFAAEGYCDEYCACRGCFNRPEHDVKIAEATQQIESRNPREFAPKIIQHATKASTKRSTQDGILLSYSRHKRGCNCILSRCSKVRCKCFQAKVGCSRACGCQGCQNAYGRQEDSPDLTRKKWMFQNKEKI